jgi:hypothetical protein
VGADYAAQFRFIYWAEPLPRRVFSYWNLLSNSALVMTSALRNGKFATTLRIAAVSGPSSVTNRST